jgi:hypothetical protein
LNKHIPLVISLQRGDGENTILEIERKGENEAFFPENLFPFFWGVGGGGAQQGVTQPSQKL